MPEEKNQMNVKETRDISPSIVEMRVDDNGKLIGYASKYGNFYNLGWFKERVAAGAFDDVLEDDVRCLKNHNPDLILGRTTNKTLQLESNSIGLRFTNDMPDTSVGRDTLEQVRRGDISGCSFSFIVAEDEWKYFEDDKKPAERTITKIGQLFDVGPVVYPANSKTTVDARDTEVAKRSLEAAKKQESENTETTTVFVNINATDTQSSYQTLDQEQKQIVAVVKQESDKNTENQDEKPKEETKEERERRQKFEKECREAAIINKRATDQINTIKNKSAEV